MKFTSALLLATTFGAISFLSAPYVVAKETNKQAHQSYKASKKVPAMRNRVYTQLARAQKLADEGNKAEGFEALNDVKDRLDSLNAYEQAMLFNFYGFMYYGDDNLAKAIESFTQVISDESSIPDSLVISTRYSLAQLSMQQQDYTGALAHLNAWKKVNPKALSANQEMLFAQVYFQDKQYIDCLMHIESAISLAVADKKNPKENWLILQRATHYELNQPKQVTEVMEQLVRLYDKPQYWLQLAGMYGEIGEEEKQIAVMEAAFQAGYITKASEITTLAQLYQFHGAPYKAAKLLSESIDNGTLVAQEKNLDMLARAYLSAKEPMKSASVLKELIKLSDNGQHEALLAQIYLNDEQWKIAATYAEQAIEKSANDKEASYLGNMYLAIGMAHFNLHHFDQSLQAFDKAKQLPKIKKTAQQWSKYVAREQETFERQQQLRLAMLN